MTAEIPPNNVAANRMLVPLIIAGCIALVLIPSIVAYMPVERSKWRLASALTLLEQNDRDQTNEGEKKKRQDQAEKFLNEAEALNSSIITNQDYIKIYWKLYPKDLEHVAKLISKQPDRDVQIKGVDDISQALFEHKDYQGVLMLVDAVFPKIENRDPQINNSWAYAAALSETRLDEAEKAVDEALKHNANFAFLDTKAWVLHKLGRNEDALVEAQKSLQEHFLATERFFQTKFLALDPQLQELKDFETSFFKSDPLAKINPEELLSKLQMVADSSNENVKELRDKLQSQSPPSPSETLLKKLPEFVENAKKGFVVLRYHRTEIIRALGLTQIADWEWEAITKAGFKDPGELE